MSKRHLTRSNSLWPRWEGQLTTLCDIKNYTGDKDSDAEMCKTCQDAVDKAENAPVARTAATLSPSALNAVASQAATENGYLQVALGTDVCRRINGDEVEKVPAWEATAVHHLLGQKLLTRGDLVRVKYGRRQVQMWEVRTK